MAWVNIKEKRPKLFGKNIKVSDYILVTNGSFVTIAYIKKSSLEPERWVFGEFGKSVDPEEITHWMKIPLLPKEDYD